MATPPVGTTTTSSIAPRSYSETQQRPSSEAIGAWSCSSSVCDLTVTSTSFATGDWVHLTGTGGIDVDDNSVTNISRSGTTVTLTLGETAILTTGERFYLEGANCAAVAGAWIADSASGTTVTFTSIESGTIASTAVSCTLNYAVEATKTGANTIRVTVSGAGTTSGSGGTLASTRLLPPEQGGTYVDPLGATVSVFLNGSSGNSSCGNGEQLRNFHSTEDPFNLSQEYLLVIANTNPHCIYSVAAGSFVSQIGTGQGASSAAKWGRRAGETTTVYYRSGATLRKIPDAITAPNSTVLVHNFNTSHSCTEIGISGPTTAHEGNGISPNGRYIAIVCKKAANEWSLISWDLESDAEEWEIDAPGDTGNIDYFHVLDDGSGGYRWSTAGSTGVAASRSGSTITFTKTGFSQGPVAAGQLFRVEGCSNVDFNRLYTIDSFTSSTLVATDAAVSATSATNCRVATQWRGIGYVDWDGITTSINPISAIGAHGQFEYDAAGHPIWVGSQNSTGFTGLTVCPTNAGISMRHVEASAYTDGTNYSSAMLCVYDQNWGGVGSSVSVRGGWVLLQTTNDNVTGPNALESNLTSNYDNFSGFGVGESEAILAELVEPGVTTPFWRLAKLRKNAPSTMYVAMSHDLRYVTWPSALRYNNGTDKGFQLLIDLGAWAQGGISFTSITPAEGTQNTTVPVVLAGAGMGGANPVINVSGTGVTVSNLVVNSATEWAADFVIAAGATAGARNVTAQTDDGTSNIVTFTVNAAAAPTISDVSPGTCVPGLAVGVVINGANFDPSATITISGANITGEAAFITATQIIGTVTCGAAAAAGTRNLSVTTDAGTTSNLPWVVLPKYTAGFGTGF